MEKMEAITHEVKSWLAGAPTGGRGKDPPKPKKIVVENGPIFQSWIK